MTTTAVRSSFRTTLQAILQEALEIPFEPGVIDGPQQDRDVGCVWWEGKRPFGRDGNVEENYYRVRVLRRFMQDQGGVEPRQTVNELLEETGELLEAALQAVLTQVGHGFFNVMEVSPDYERHAVEAQLVAYDRNRSSAGG
jgi:hypothetical protein